MPVITSIGLYKSFSNRKVHTCFAEPFYVHLLQVKGVEYYIQSRILYVSYISYVASSRCFWGGVLHELSIEFVKQYLDIQLYFTGWLANFMESRREVWKLTGINLNQSFLCI